MHNELKAQFLKIDEIPSEEIDVLFSIITGGEFQGLTSGSHAISNDNQKVTIVGFSDQWDQPNNLTKLETDKFKSLNVKLSATSPQDKIIGLYYDETAKERQELIALQMFDVNIVCHIDKEEKEKIFQMSILNDMEIIKKFVSVLQSLEKDPENLTADQKVKRQQLYVNMLNSITNMIQSGGEKYITLMRENGLLEPLLQHLYQKQTQQLTLKKIVPLEWLELKYVEIKRKALENDVSLIPNLGENTASIMNKKQIILQSSDPTTGDTVIQNAHLLSAINLQNISNDQIFKSHLGKDLVNFMSEFDQELEPNPILNKKYGLVFYDSQELMKLDNKAINILLNSQVVVTTNDIQPKELFTQMVQLVKKDDEKEEKLRCLLGLLESVILFIRKVDFERIQLPISLNFENHIKSQKSLVEGVIKELQSWSNVDYDYMLSSIIDHQDRAYNIIANYALKAIQNLYEEKQKNQDKIKKLEVDKKFKEVEQLKVKIAENETKKKKEIEEKLAEFKKQGFGRTAQKSLIEELAEQSDANESRENFDKDFEIEDLLKDETFTKKLDEIIEKKIKPFSEDKLDDEAKSKSVKQGQESFWDAVLKIDIKQLTKEYEETINSIAHLESRKALVSILANSDLSTFLPGVMKDKKSQKIFTCFIRTAFNDALILYLNTGQKNQYKTIKSIIRKLFKFCDESPEFSNYLRNFLRFDIIQSSVLTITKMKQNPGKSVKEYFNTEHIILNELNPYLFIYVASQFLRKYPSFIQEQPKYIPAMFNYALCMFTFLQQQKSSIVNQLLTLIIEILKYSDDNLEQVVRDKSIDSLLNHELLKYIILHIDYDNQTKFNNQQKLLLEIHMKLLDIFHKIGDRNLRQVDSNLENSAGILKVKRGQKVLSDKENFDFIKYYIHFKALEEYQTEMMNINIETNHYAYDAKILAKFTMKQVEKLTIAFNDKTQLKEFTFVGIANNATGKSISYYTQEDIKGKDKAVELFKGDFYILYPIKKQLVVAFGDGSNERLGVAGSSSTLPKAAYSTSNLKPMQIFTANCFAIVVNEEKELYKCGTISKKMGGAASTYEKIVGLRGKVNLVACGRSSLYVVNDQNEIFRQGYSKDGHLGLNTEYSSLTAMDKIDDEQQITEKIVDISSASHFTLFVTEDGKLYGIGNRLMKELGLDCDQKIINIPLKEGAKVLKAYASMGKNSPLAFLKVQLENGKIEFWSAGKNEQGLLGQGQQVKHSKLFKPLKFDQENIQFVEFSCYGDHAMAIDQNGQLWAWGCNLSKRAGFKEDIYDGIFEPKKVTFPAKEKLTPLKISCGFDHTLIIFEDESKEKKLYSVGQDEKIFHHLGLTQIEAEDKNNYYREVTAFRGFNIVDFKAGHRSSHVIIEGEKEPTDNLHSHKVNGELKTGILHVYKDEAGKLQYLTQDEYEAKKDTLPDICLALKSQVENLENIELPDLNDLAKELIDQESTDTTHDGLQCNLTLQPLNGVRYFSFSKINGDNQKVDLCETAFMQPNSFDINPLIYYRIKKPLKKGARLPIIDLKQYYKESSSYGLDIEIKPDLSYQKNEKMIELTKTSYDELCDSASKFASDLDQDLLREMDRYVRSNLNDKLLEDITVKNDFKIADMTFKNVKIKKLQESVKRRRIEMYLSFNQIFLNIMPYISLDDKASKGDMTKSFQTVKGMILFSMKNKFILNQVTSLETGSSGYVEIRRRKAQRFCETGQVDHKGEHTIFGQIFQSLKLSGFSAFKQNSTDSRVYSAKFIGEGSIDAGGPYRESLTNICSELESENLPLLIKTANNRNNHGENRDCFIPNLNSNNPTHIEMFKFLGYLLGYGIRAMSPLQLHFPPVFWKQILNDPLTAFDLKGFDTYSWKIIEDLKKQAKKLSDKEFSAVVEEAFVTRLSDGSEVELKQNGKDIIVNKENLDEYCDLILQKRFSEYKTQIDAIREGIDYIIPISILKLFTWEEVEIRACGDKILDIEKLKKFTRYYACEENNEFVQRFWRVLADMTDEEQMLYLKFVWGRTRLPYDTSKVRDNHTIYLCQSRGDKEFPEAHTWQNKLILIIFSFFQLDLPKYTTDEICKQRLVTAVTMCGEIDTDGSAAYIPDDNDEE
ncbi:hect e3 ubiquitin [Stylonychia lemnae]|uniref:Hect e3 ubiquitin n=1 Tax=Stylonychia lemnae TaxID=5949 RepID=A0A078ARV4_STYLE|nr:hect e3 ubiquitin [Stylonychia lemnae]|eukprot:CDW84904.1 hect e3 ubiquitin [Stylonychia lemnae]